MLLGQPQPTRPKKVHVPDRPKPVQPLKDYRCSDCQILDPPTIPSIHLLETCPHQPAFAPSPNSFSLLAGLAQSPTGSKWAFDFVPAKHAATKRRSRRGGKRHRTRRSVPKQCEKLESNKSSEICERVIALRPRDEEVPSLSPESLPRNEFDLTIPLATFSAKSVRYHWAPQLRPNSLLNPWSSSVEGAALPQDPNLALSRISVVRTLNATPICIEGSISAPSFFHSLHNSPSNQQSPIAPAPSQALIEKSQLYNNQGTFNDMSQSTSSAARTEIETLWDNLNIDTFAKAKGAIPNSPWCMNDRDPIFMPRQGDGEFLLPHKSPASNPSSDSDSDWITGVEGMEQMRDFERWLALPTRKPQASKPLSESDSDWIAGIEEMEQMRDFERWLALPKNHESTALTPPSESGSDWTNLHDTTHAKYPIPPPYTPTAFSDPDPWRHAWSEFSDSESDTSSEFSDSFTDIWDDAKRFSIPSSTRPILRINISNPSVSPLPSPVSSSPLKIIHRPLAGTDYASRYAHLSAEESLNQCTCSVCVPRAHGRVRDGYFEGLWEGS